MLDYLAWTLVHLGWWIAMLLASAGLGHLFLRKVRFRSFAEQLVFTLSLGLGLWALALFCLGLAGALYSSIILGLSIAAAAGTILLIIRLLNNNRLTGLPSLEYYKSRNGLLTISLSIIAFGYWALLLLLTQYPPLLWDATSNHLVLAREYLTHHEIVPVTGVAQPVVPALNHMLFAWGLALEDDISAQLMEHTLMMLTALGLYAWGKREGSPLFGIAAAGLWLAHPIIILLGRTAYTDVGVACFVFLGIYGLRVFWDEREASWWYLSLALLAMAAGTKLSGLFFLILGCGLGLLALIQSLINRRKLARAPAIISDNIKPEAPPIPWKIIVLGWGLALIIAMPWYGFIAHETGNPVWPAFPHLSSGIWGAPHVQSSFDRLLSFTATPRTFYSFLKLPFDWEYHPDLFQSEISPPLSPFMIVWPFAWLVALWNRTVRWWALWALAFTIFWFFNAQHLRHWIPALPLAGLALYQSVRCLIERFSMPAIPHYIIWICLFLFTVVWGGRRVVSELFYKGPPPISSAAREDFLTRTYLGYDGVKYINKHAGNDEVVCVIGGSWLNYYFQLRVIDLVGPLYENSRPTFRWPDDQAWAQWLDSNKVSWIFLTHAKPQELYSPEKGIIKSSFWPDYELVYADSAVWAFRRKPVPPNVGLSPRKLRPLVDQPNSRRVPQLSPVKFFN